MSFHERTTDAAKGKWKGILLSLGLPESVLQDKHGPCPICQDGTDRFRWDNKGGTGSYICTHCGAGDGMKLAELFTGKSFSQVATMIDAMIGNIKPDSQPAKTEMSDPDRRQILRSVWTETKPVALGDLAHVYLATRGVAEFIHPKALRYGVLRDGEGGIRPCMVAIVSDADGKPSTMHRTFLRPDGKAKAEMDAPRKMMPGAMPDGGCVRLSEFGGGSIGIAEGIETAMSASALYSLPVWAALNTAALAKWQPPDGCEDVAIFSDNDKKFGGQAAAFALAHRLAVKNMPVTVHIPDIAGTDWNDVLLQRIKT